MVEKQSYTLLIFSLLCFLMSSNTKVYPLAPTIVILGTTMKFYLELWIAFNFINFTYKSNDPSNHISTLMPQIVYCIIKRTFTMIIT